MGLQGQLGEIRGLKAELVAISTDAPANVRQTVGQLNLDFPVLSDPEKNIFRLYEVLDTQDGRVLPAALVIDAQGIVRFREVTPTSVERTSPQTILDALQRL